MQTHTYTQTHNAVSQAAAPSDLVIGRFFGTHCTASETFV